MRWLRPLSGSRRFVHPAALVVAVAAMLVLRGSLISTRRQRGEELGIPRAGPASAPRAQAAVGASPDLLASAATGVFRALAIDYLWIRAARLQERGQFFDSAATARLVTSLQPRLPTAWTFQARNLAYNITPSLPPEERYPWVLEAISLLRDGALLHNPGNPAVLLDLAFIFQHKIGLDFDDAGALYRAKLAQTFEVHAESVEAQEERERWGIDAGALQRVEGEWGVRLDFRSAESHALYWATLGLWSPKVGNDPYVRRALELVSRGSILQLFSTGHPVPAVRKNGPSGRLYAFIPDLRFEAPLRRVLALELQRVEGVPSRRAPVEDFVLEQKGRLALYLFLFGREEEARAVFHEDRERWASEVADFEGLLLVGARHLAGASGDLTSMQAEAVKKEVVALLDAALLLDLAGEPVPARGCRALARRLLDAAPRAEPGGAVPSFEACLGAAARRRCGPWRTDDELWQDAPEIVRRLGGMDGPTAESLGLPEVTELPLRLELLDPAGEGNGL